MWWVIGFCVATTIVAIVFTVLGNDDDNDKHDDIKKRIDWHIKNG